MNKTIVLLSSGFKSALTLDYSIEDNFSSDYSDSSDSSDSSDVSSGEDNNEF